MTNRGRHASDDTGGFYKDLAVMILGIIVVGGAVFGLLVLVADGPPPEPTEPVPVAGSTTSTIVGASTTATIADTTTTSTTTTTTTTVPVRSPEEVRVVVLNSVGIAGAAGRMTSRLDEMGYQTLPADDFSPQLDPSRVWYRGDFAAEASELLELLPGAVVEEVPAEQAELAVGADLILVLGTGYEE